MKHKHTHTHIAEIADCIRIHVLWSLLISFVLDWARCCVLLSIHSVCQREEKSDKSQHFLRRAKRRQFFVRTLSQSRRKLTHAHATPTAPAFLRTKPYMKSLSSCVNCLTMLAVYSSVRSKTAAFFCLIDGGKLVCFIIAKPTRKNGKTHLMVWLNRKINLQRVILSQKKKIYWDAKKNAFKFIRISTRFHCEKKTIFQQLFAGEKNTSTFRWPTHIHHSFQWCSSRIMIMNLCPTRNRRRVEKKCHWRNRNSIRANRISSNRNCSTFDMIQQYLMFSQSKRRRLWFLLLLRLSTLADNNTLDCDTKRRKWN